MVSIMKNKSIWTKDIEKSGMKILDKDIETDILIIGGGMTGITTAYFLKDSKYKITLVDQNLVGMGVTSKSTAKINYLQETIYTDLINNYSFNIASKYLESQIFAIEEINRIITKEKIKCDLEQVESFVFTDKKKEINKLKTENSFLKKNGVNVKEYKSISPKLKSKYAISVSDTYVFHPLKYLYSLKDICLQNNINIYEKTRIQKIKKTTDGYICFANNNKIKAQKIVLANHYPFFLKPFFMPLKVYTEKSYITASKTRKYKKETFITSNLPTKSIRYHKDKNKYLIYLSNSHNICNDLNEKKNFIKAIKETKKLKLKPEYIWENDDVMTIDRLPYIGCLEKNNTNLLIGTGYNTWGMTNATLAGYILSNILLNHENKYIDLFNPLRTNRFNNLKSYFLILGSTLKSYIGNKIIKNKKWYSNRVKFFKKDGKNLAVYNDGIKKHIVYTTCPHMGCTLIFNEVEHTWDCPCHASRFDLDGKCIKGPSCYDISFEKK